MPVKECGRGHEQPGIALITGANKGIGLEVVRQLVARGWHVFLAARNRDAGVKATSTLQQAGSNQRVQRGRVTD